ncbi:MAG TPA: tRNA (adenosine(37)-N6)-dimethylallyltransferase MiaA [Tepidisphaeraceae bacterium]|nr:tRNA (adenosine(37)-N6)-dimethylallyltransferase MiaA [Tepidisphaeraceae bacterium]
MADQPNIIVILGPTASGKSDLAMRVAQKIGAQILSVDSMQIYRHMNIGTAKPSAAERQQVVHHLIDVVNPDETFAVAQFVEQADQIISDSVRRNIPLIATGGTPLYYKSLFEGLFEGPSADANLRLRLSATPLAELHTRLQRIDPAAAQRIHVNDRRRLVRALEVYELTGQAISSFQTEWTSGQARHAARWFGLNWDRDELNRRINARVKTMIDAGWVDETRDLLKRFDALSKTAVEATGYRELIDQLQGKMSLDNAIEQIKIATRQLARRQMKWFRRFKHVQWLQGNSSPGELVEQVMNSFH